MRRRDPDFELGRLCAAMQKSRLQLRWMRDLRTDMVRQYTGAHWSEDAAERTTPINLISLYVNIIGRKLVPKNPRVMLSTFERVHKPAVSIMQEWGNQQIEKMRLAETLRRVVIDALFSVGVAKVALAGPAESALSGWQVKAGEPFVEAIDFDDLVFDIHARDFRNVGYIGHRFRVPLEVVRESKIYGRGRKKLDATPDRMFNAEGDERISMLGRGYYSNEEEYEDFIDLWEIYLPRHRLVVTVTDDDLTGAASGGVSADDVHGKGRRKALREQRWLGPECGPYHVLGFGVVPGNVMPKGPVQDIYDLHGAVNNIARKLIRQAQRQKSVMPVTSQEEYERLQTTEDGAGFRSDRPQDMKEARYGGPDQSNFLLMENLVNRVSWMSGNLELIGGLGPQAKTLGQDKLNEQSSSSNIGSLQDDTVNFTSDVLRSLCWFWHNHPTKVMKVKHTLPGLNDISMVRRSFPANEELAAAGKVTRAHSFEEMQVKVDPYSMQHQTPQQRSQMILQAIQQVYAPLAQMCQQQGIVLDMNEVMKKLGEYWDMPDLADIFTLQEPPDSEPSGGTGFRHDGAGVKPSQTSREYIRRSLGGDSQQSREALVSNAMKGGMNGKQANGAMQ